MRRRRKRPKDESLGSLDSLLDTMTTVVGILLIILIVLQLDVSKAVERIVREKTTDGPKVEQKDLDERQKEIDAMRERMITLAEDRKKKQAVAADLQTKTKTREAKLAALRTTLARTKTAASTADLKKLEAKLTAELKVQNQLLTKTGQRYNELTALLAKTPVPTKAKPNNITIPKPRPAASGTAIIRYVCRAGKIYPVDEVGLRKIVAESIKKSKAKQNAAKEYDPKPIIAYFKSKDVGDKHFRLEAFVSGDKSVLFRLHRRRTGGTHGSQLSNFNASFQTGLRKIDRKKNAILFMVWPDSFISYTRARTYLDRQKIPAGWEPREDAAEWNVRLGWFTTHGRKAYEEEQKKKNAAKPPAPKKPPAKPKNVLD